MKTGEPLLLGVDGGNTKSIALLAATDGSILGSGRSPGTSDIHAVPIEEATARLLDATDRAFQAAGRPDAPIVGSVLSLAGADWPEDFHDLGAALGSRLPDVQVVNDAIGALRASVPRGPGVVVVCGTGATTGARGRNGEIWHSSFWQETQGAQELGVLALQAVCRSKLGIDPPTALTPRLLRATGEPKVEALLRRMTARSRRVRFGHTDFAPILLDAAEDGDTTALAIVQRHGAALGRMALAAARQVGLDRGPWTLALTGGVFRHGGRAHRNALLEAVRSAAPDVAVVVSATEPAVGALLLAFDRGGIPVDDRLEGRIRETLPPATLFDTYPRPDLVQA